MSPCTIWDHVFLQCLTILIVRITDWLWERSRGK